MVVSWPAGAAPVVSMAFGSHVYGTDLDTSDRDVKGVFLPSARAILLQRVEDTVVLSTKAEPERANTSADVDVELFSLQRFLGLLLDGQTNALDMLFTPERFYLAPPAAVWDELRREKDRFLHRGVTMFARYCRQQAVKYGIKGSRLSALRSALALLSTFDERKSLWHYRAELETLVGSQPEGARRQLRLIVLEEAPAKRPSPCLEVAGRKVQLGVTVKLARRMLQRSFDEFGQRAILAERNEGVDWKALMHAVRVAKQAEELLLTGSVTFPRPERELLLRIRKGELPYKQVAELVEEGVEAIEDAAAKSPLPETPDAAFAEALVLREYAAQMR